MFLTLKNAPQAYGEEARTAPTLSNEDAEIERLAQLSPIEYERARGEAAEVLGVRNSILDQLVVARRKELEGDPEDAHDELSRGIEPWESPVDGRLIAQEIHALLRRYTILPEGGYEAVTLWAVGSYVYDAFRIFPKLCLSSPEKRCGKTTLLETLGAVVSRALMASNMSPAVIFRAVEAWTPALLIDEGDTFLHGNEELRGIINSGHTRSTAFVLRVEEVGGVREPKRFSTWAPMAIAMIKTPPDTILDRSVLVRLRRKMPDESVARLPLDLLSDCRDIRRKIQRWADDHIDTLAGSFPDIPKVGSDRAEDNWLPLITIAEALGGEWPKLARNAMTMLEAGKGGDDDGIGPMILADIRKVFEEADTGRLHSQDMVDRLVDMDDRPWIEWKHGKPMTKTSLSRLLRPYGIKTKDIRIGYAVKKGYNENDFEDAFGRYLAATPFQSATTLQTNGGTGCSVAFCNSGTSPENQNATRQASNGDGCSGVAFQTEGAAEMTPASEEFDL